MNALVPTRPGANIKPRHKSVARAVGFCLAANLPTAWWQLVDVLRARLDPCERIALAVMALEALDDADVLMVARGVVGLPEGAGPPVPPFGDGLAEAELWVTAAAPAELRAYVLTAFNALSRRDRIDFLDHLNGRSAA